MGRIIRFLRAYRHGGLAGFLALLAFFSAADPARAADAAAAVAANFTAPAKEIAAKYKELTGYAVDLSFGASGQLYTQITQGAPFDMFLSADNERTEKTLKDGLAVPGSAFTYAVGKLVLWSADPNLVDRNGDVLKKANFTHLSLANPKAAPYGAAAVETLNALGVYKALESRIVTGENIGQAFQFVVSKNAELGFVAYSQVIAVKGGSMWLVPERLYAPIVQDAVLLKRGAGNPVAKGFYAFLKGKEARAIVLRYGYAVPARK
jgi:molybdate transport system substrate-binding protein